MDLAGSLQVSLIGFAVVFLVLMLLCLLIKIQSVLLGYITMQNSVPEAEPIIFADESSTVNDNWSAGELKLIGIDEKTAAMIMAIVSHESQIPLSELRFKIIRAID